MALTFSYQTPLIPVRDNLALTFSCGLAGEPMPKRKLTELSVRKLPPAAATYLVWDTHQRGLAIRIQPTGRKSWYVVYSRRGRPRWLRLGDAGAIGLADARTLAAEAMLAVARGKDPAA